MRRFGEPREQGRSYVRRPGVYAILAHGRDLLLTHQSEPAPEFQLPGGGIDPGESPLAALHREVLEETGWRIADVRRLGPPREAGHDALWADAEVAAEILGNEGDRDFVRRYFSGELPR